MPLLYHNIPPQIFQLNHKYNMPKHISFFSFKCDSCLTPGETGSQ